MASKTGPIMIKIRNNGVVDIYDERGDYISHLPGCDWATATVSGERVVASKHGRTEIYNRNGDYVGHL